MEWYDPEAITTENGSLVITFSRKDTHNLQYEGGKSMSSFCMCESSGANNGRANCSGMMSTWLVPFSLTLGIKIAHLCLKRLPRNKFCFTGGYIEASVQLPGYNNILGFWPAIWAMGNLGRAGYGASLEGTVSPTAIFSFPFHLHNSSPTFTVSTPSKNLTCLWVSVAIYLR